MPAAPRVRRRDALAPLRQALLDAARAEARQILARADQTVRDMLRDAQAQAGEIQQQSRARSATDTAELIAVRRTQAQSQARALVLAAERAEYEALREAARQAVARIGDDPEYPHVRQRMAAALRRLLGDEARVHDAPGGGLIADAPGRSADYSFLRLADRAVDTVLAEESAERASQRGTSEERSAAERAERASDSAERASQRGTSEERSAAERAERASDSAQRASDSAAVAR